MSEQESNVCAICGGLTRIAYTIEFRECMPHSISVDPSQVVVPHMRLCPGHPEPVPTPDGKLSHLTQSAIAYWLRGLRKGFGVDLNDIYADREPSEQDWLRALQELYDLSDGSEEVLELQRLAKEQEQ